MKKKQILLIALVFALLLCACGKTAAPAEMPAAEKNDAGFLTLLAQGLEARWQLSDTTDYETDSEYPAYVTNLIHAELDTLGSFSDYTFADAGLQELAKQYFDALNKQLEGASYFNTNYELYNQVFMAEGYNVRAKVLGKLAADYDLTVSEQYASDLTDFITLYNRFSAIDALVQQPLVMTNLGDECELVIENTSGHALQQVMVEARFVDDAGVVVDMWAEYIDNWDAGSKNKLVFLAMDTTYTHIDLRINVVTENYVTEWVSAEFVNEMVVEIIADNLNTEVDYGYGSVKMGSCMVEDFRYEITHWNEGKANIKLFFSGVRTAEGQDASLPGTHCNFTYILLDEAGNVAASGSAFVDNVALNERFQELEVYPGYLAPGTYHLVIDDYYLTF